METGNHGQESILSEPRFNDDTAAREYLESVLWPDGPVCPHCGMINHAYKTKRAGVYRCAEKECRKDFTVTMKTVMERQPYRPAQVAAAFHLMTASKKGISAHQLHRTLGIGYEAAWFMAHRIREAMRAGGLDSSAHGRRRQDRGSRRNLLWPRRQGEPSHQDDAAAIPSPRSGKNANKRPIVALVERGGSVRTFHAAVADKDAINKIIGENIARESPPAHR